MAGDLDLFDRHIEVGEEKPDEEARHFGIRIGELNLVSVFRSFRPVQHATGYEQRILSSGKLATFVLKRDALHPALSSMGSRSTELTVKGGIHGEQHSALLTGQFDVPDPEAYRRLGDAEPPSNIVDWKSVFATKLPRKLTFFCFHFRKQ